MPLSFTNIRKFLAHGVNNLAIALLGTCVHTSAAAAICDWAGPMEKLVNVVKTTETSVISWSERPSQLETTSSYDCDSTYFVTEKITYEIGAQVSDATEYYPGRMVPLVKTTAGSATNPYSNTLYQGEPGQQASLIANYIADANALGTEPCTPLQSADFYSGENFYNEYGKVEILVNGQIVLAGRYPEGVVKVGDELLLGRWNIWRTPSGGGFSCSPQIYGATFVATVTEILEPVGFGRIYESEAKFQLHKHTEVTYEPTCPGKILENGKCVNRGIDPKKNLGDSCHDVGNPCNAATGNKHQTEVDYVGTGTFPLQFNRVYNSASVEPGSFGRQWRGTYDRKLVFRYGKSTIIVRDDGKQHMFFYDDTAIDKDVNWRLISLVDANYKRLGWRYESNQREVEYYNAAGKLQSITNRQGLTQTLAYSCTMLGPACPIPTAPAIALSDGLLVSVTDPAGRQLHFAYDEFNRVATMTDPSGKLYTYTYSDDSASANLVSITYPDGKIRTYIYGEVEHVSASPAPAVHYAHSLTGLIDENGDRFATWRYDELGRVVASQHGPDSNRTIISYATGASTVTSPTGTARIMNIKPVEGTAKRNGAYQPGGSGSDAVWQPAPIYDNRGNVIDSTDLAGVRRTYTYFTGQNIEETRTEYLATSPYRTFSTIMNWNVLLPAVVSSPGKATYYQYDSVGNVLQTQLTFGQQTRSWSYTRNNFGQVLTATGPRNATDTYVYDTVGNLTSIKNALNHEIRILAYNAHGRPTHMVEPNGLETFFEYDDRQRLTARTVGTRRTTYEHDGVGQLTRTTNPDGSSLNYVYDTAHRLKVISDGDGNRIEYSLDGEGNRIGEVRMDPSGLLTRQITSVYDALGRLMLITGGVK